MVVSEKNEKENDRTLSEILGEFKIEHVEILKIDIEWAEFAMIPEIFHDKMVGPRICRICFELSTHLTYSGIYHVSTTY